MCWFKVPRWKVSGGKVLWRFTMVFSWRENARENSALVLCVSYHIEYVHIFCVRMVTGWSSSKQYWGVRVCVNNTNILLVPYHTIPYTPPTNIVQSNCYITSSVIGLSRRNWYLIYKHQIFVVMTVRKIREWRYVRLQIGTARVRAPTRQAKHVGLMWCDVM